MELDLLVEDPRWNAVDLDALALCAIRAAIDHMGLAEQSVEVSVLACDDARIAVLNRDFREKATATNVLSWPSEDLGAAVSGDDPSPPNPDPDGTSALGDIAIAYDTCAREASAAGKPLADHVTHLLVHGTLHLLGYDHIRDPDAALMQRLETEILGKLGLDDPYMS
jgi:probable rRNA maturation factor